MNEIKKKVNELKQIGFISDLHIDSSHEYQPADFLSALAQLMTDHCLDQLVIGGDITNHYSTTIQFVERLQNQTGIPVYFIPGNHDYWEMGERIPDSEKVHQIFIEHPQSLMNKPIILNDEIGLVGNPGWYNHAYHDKRFSKEELEIGKYRMATWQDKVYTKWQQSDADLSKTFIFDTEQDILRVDRPNIILVTHVITIPEFTIPLPNKVFDFFNAYIATDDFDEIYQKYNVTHSIMGHVHYRGEINRDGTRFVTNSLGYQKQWWTNELYRELTDSLWVFNY